MLNGSIVALLTPLTERGETDFAALDALVEFHLVNGTAAAQLAWREAERINTALNSLFDVLMIETNPIPVKWTLFEMGLIKA